MSAPDPTIAWKDSFELDRAAEAAYIEHELQVRGDGMWRPWQCLDARPREHWERIATAVFREVNRGRMEQHAKVEELS